jgi:hypothetical protein
VWLRGKGCGLGERERGLGGMALEFGENGNGLLERGRGFREKGMAYGKGVWLRGQGAWPMTQGLYHRERVALLQF